MKQTHIVECGGRTFETVTVMEAGFHGAMAVVHIYEVVRPNWKFFRTRWIDTKNFWVSDFPTIADGVLRMVERVIEADLENAELRKKWDEFCK